MPSRSSVHKLERKTVRVSNGFFFFQPGHTLEWMRVDSERKHKENVTWWHASDCSVWLYIHSAWRIVSHFACLSNKLINAMRINRNNQTKYVLAKCWSASSIFYFFLIYASFIFGSLTVYPCFSAILVVDINIFQHYPIYLLLLST